jgi:hypothetical protein
MKRVKVLLNFLNLSIAIKILFYRSIISNLTGNAYFLVPSVSLDVATAAVDALEAASIAAKDGAHLNISIRNDAEKAADEIFRNLASYVEFTALGDETTIISSGFAPSQQPVPTFKAILSATHGSHSGNVKLATPKAPRTYAHIWRMRKKSVNGIENPWIDITTTTQATYEVTGLDVGVEYEFEVADLTPEGITEYCQAVSILVI